MYSYSPSLGYPTIYRFLYHIQELLDVQLQHIAWLPGHIQISLPHTGAIGSTVTAHRLATQPLQISLPHTGAIGCTVTAHRLATRPYTDFSTTYMSYWMYSYSTSLGYPTIYRFLYHIHELLDVQLQHIAWLPDHLQISLPHTGAIGCTVTAHRLATRPLQISLPHTGAIGCTVTAHRLATRPYTDFSTTYRSYWMYSYSTSLGYPTIYRFLYHIQELLDLQLQHIAWLPDHIQISLPHTGAIGCTVTAHRLATRPYTDFSTTYRSYWMYSYSTSLGYPTIYRFLYHIHELLDVQLQHIAWLPDHIQISLPHTGAIGCTVTAHRLATRPYTDFSTTYRSYWMYSYSTSLGYPTIYRFLYHIQELLDVQLQHIAWLPDHYRFLYHIQELLDVQLQHIAWLPDHIQISLPHTGAIGCTVTAHRLATKPYTDFSTTYRSYWMYSYSTSLDYQTIYRFLYHIHELLDVQLQHIAWLPDHVHISLPHAGPI